MTPTLGDALAQINRNEDAARRLPEPLRSHGIAVAEALRADNLALSRQTGAQGLGIAPLVGWSIVAGAGAIGAWIQRHWSAVRAETKRLECVDALVDQGVPPEEAGRICNPPDALTVPPWAWGVGIGVTALIALAILRR